MIHLEDAIVQFERISLLHLYFFKYLWVHLYSNAIHCRPIMPFFEEVVVALLDLLINPFEIDFIYLGALWVLLAFLMVIEVDLIFGQMIFGHIYQEA